MHQGQGPFKNSKALLFNVLHYMQFYVPGVSLSLMR